MKRSKWIGRAIAIVLLNGSRLHWLQRQHLLCIASLVCNENTA